MKSKLIIVIVISSFLSVLFDLLIPAFMETNVLSALKYLLYFTVQCNIIVFIYFLLLFMGRKRDQDKFHIMFGGVLLYIFITMTVFILFLQRLYFPTGARVYGNLFSHYITPTLVIVYYFRQRDYYLFKMEHIKLWIIYPLLYMIIAVVFGMITGDYLYPFFQIDIVGISGLIISVITLVFFFLVLSFSLVKMVSKE